MKVKSILSTLLGTAIGATSATIATKQTIKKDVDKWKAKSDKHLTLFKLMSEWMKTKQEGKNIKTYFETNGYKSVAIYGLSYMGERLLDELENSGIEVKYAIDRNADSIYSDIDIFSPEDTLPDVDVIVVTAVCFFDEIEADLDDLVSCPIISLEDIIYGI